MATLENEAFGILKSASTGTKSGLYKVDSVIKTFTGSTCAQDALDEISKVNGNDEFLIVQKVARTSTEVITT